MIHRDSPRPEGQDLVELAESGQSRINFRESLGDPVQISTFQNELLFQDVQ